MQLPSIKPQNRVAGKYETSARELREGGQHSELFDLVSDSLDSKVVLADSEGYIVYLTKPYGRLLGVDPTAQVGKHVTEVIENTRLHIVAKTGKAEFNQTQRIKGQDMVVERIPIKRAGKVVAVLGHVMFEDVSEVTKLAKKLSLLESKVQFYEKELLSLRSTRYTFDSIKGVSDSIISLKKDAAKAASLNRPIFIAGESGTGKELFAQAIHTASPRKFYPFVKIDCASIPKDLLESELFGYVKGAFTGARSDGRMGKFELAQHGTVFLDEIGDLPIEMQPKLLRVLEERQFERIGGNTLVKADFRLITATNKNLEEMLGENRFRKDLFYRVNVIPIHIPPLRERKEDIIPLAHHLLERITQDSGSLEVKLDPHAEKALEGYDWPGNVRELSNVLERVVSSVERDTIYLCDLPFYLYRNRRTKSESNDTSLKSIHGRAEKEAIHYALESTNYNKARAAKLLGIHRSVLYKKMKKYNLPLNQTSPSF